MSKKAILIYLTVPNPALQEVLIRAGYMLTFDVDKADLIVFPEGPHVLPVLYGEKPLENTHYNVRRDLAEVKLFYSLTRKIPKVGVGRGASFLCVMNGGPLYQLVDGHDKDCDTHQILTENSDIIVVTTRHTQMMIPPENSVILSSAAEARHKETEETLDIVPEEAELSFDDPEVVWIKDTQTLLFQPRPEIGHVTTRDYFLNLLQEYPLKGMC